MAGVKHTQQEEEIKLGKTGASPAGQGLNPMPKQDLQLGWGWKWSREPWRL
jgi:hypothetical protein